MRVVLEHLRAEGALRERARREALVRLGERIRHARQVACRVDIADEALGRLDLVGDAVQPRGEGGGEREIRIGVGAGDAALDAQARAFAHHAEAGRAVVVAPREARRRPRGVDVPFI